MPTRSARRWAWVLAAVAASSRPRAAIGSQPEQATAQVFASGSVEPTIVLPGSVRWFDAATVAAVEWTYGPSDPIAPVEANAGGGRWHFYVDRTLRWAALAVTAEIRAAWDLAGTLQVSCQGGAGVSLRARPRRLLLPSEGVAFSVTQRGAAFVPGSAEWAEVFLDDLTLGQVRLGVRAVEGEALAEPRSVLPGDEDPFRIGEEEYAIQVERLKNRLIGEDHAELRVKKREAAPPEKPPGPGKEARRGEESHPQAERAEEGRPAEEADLSIEAPRPSGPGEEPPTWSEAIEAIERDLREADGRVARAQTLLGEGRAAESRTVLEAARRILELSRQRLRSTRWRPRLQIRPDGEEFSVEQRDCSSVPGSRGWIEVVLTDIHGTEVRLGVRTAGGETLAAPRPVASGTEVGFRSGEEGYAIRVERLRNAPIGRDYADLRVIRRDAPPLGGNERPRAGKRQEDEAGVPNRGPDASLPGPGKPIGAKLIELIARELATAEERATLAERALAEDKAEEARAALEGIRRSQEQAQQGLRWIRKLSGKELMEGRLSVIEDLSLIKARIARALPEFELPVDPDPAHGVFGRVSERLRDGLFAQYIEAEVLEPNTVGSRFASGTEMGRRAPSEKRHDLEPGRTIELHLWERRNDFPGLEGLEEGRQYWLAITPPLALKAIPRMAGTMGRTWIAFAMPATDR